jgi:hypothetical protein
MNFLKRHNKDLTTAYYQDEINETWNKNHETDIPDKDIVSTVLTSVFSWTLQESKDLKK